MQCSVHMYMYALKGNSCEMIRWFSNSVLIVSDEATLEEMFGKKEIKPRKITKSSFTKLLKHTNDSGSTNPFEEYKQFNGEVRT